MYKVVMFSAGVEADSRYRWRAWHFYVTVAVTQATLNDMSRCLQCFYHRGSVRERKLSKNSELEL